jgi:hypothetical protein
VQQVFQHPFRADGGTARESRGAWGAPTQQGSTAPIPRGLHASATHEVRTQVNYLRRMAALISDPNTARSLLEIATQFQQQLTASHAGCVTEVARRAMVRRMRGRA